MSETLHSYGPDSFIGLLTSTLQGSTETTFYVLALYLGAARVTDGRHALAAFSLIVLLISCFDFSAISSIRTG